MNASVKLNSSNGLLQRNQRTFTRSMSENKENIAPTTTKNKTNTGTGFKKPLLANSRGVLNEIDNKKNMTNKNNMSENKENFAPAMTKNKNKITRTNTGTVFRKPLAVNSRAAFSEISNDEKENMTNIKITKSKKLGDIGRSTAFASTNKNSSDLTKKLTRSVTTDKENNAKTNAKSWRTSRSKSETTKTSTNLSQKVSTNANTKTGSKKLKTSTSLADPNLKTSTVSTTSTRADFKLKRQTVSEHTISPIKTPIVEVSPRKMEILASVPTAYNTMMKKRSRKPSLAKLGTICEDDSLIIPDEDEMQRTVQFKRGCGFIIFDDSGDEWDETRNINFFRGTYTNKSDDESNTVIDE